MPYANWSDKFSIGHPVIDQHHQRLFALVNNLYDAIEAGHGHDVLEKTFNDLIQYTAYHFKYEEGQLLQANYPAYEEHKNEHDKLTSQVIDAQSRFHESKDPTQPKEVLEFLKTWLFRHILESDRRFALFLNTNES